MFQAAVSIFCTNVVLFCHNISKLKHCNKSSPELQNRLLKQISAVNLHQKILIFDDVIFKIMSLRVQEKNNVRKCHKMTGCWAHVYCLDYNHAKSIEISFIDGIFMKIIFFSLGFQYKFFQISFVCILIFAGYLSPTDCIEKLVAFQLSHCPSNAKIVDKSHFKHYNDQKSKFLPMVSRLFFVRGSFQSEPLCGKLNFFLNFATKFSFSRPDSSLLHLERFQWLK